MSSEDLSSEELSNKMLNSCNEFSCIDNENISNKKNFQLNAIHEQKLHDSPIIETINKISAENINKNGIPIFYIPIETNGNKDKIMGDPEFKFATGVFYNMKFATDTNSYPVFANQKTSFTFSNFLASYSFFVNKTDFYNKSNNDIDKLINTSNYWTEDKKNYIPKQGDILIIDNDFKNAFEITDVDDDQFLYFNRRDYWILTIQNYTKQNIDFSYINEFINKYDLSDILQNYKSEDRTTSNNIINSNDNLKSDNRNKSKVDDKSDDNDSPFEQVFGKWN